MLKTITIEVEVEGEDDFETIAQETIEIASKIGDGYTSGQTPAGSNWQIENK